jgi:hypothetical protein
VKQNTENSFDRGDQISIDECPAEEIRHTMLSCRSHDEITFENTIVFTVFSESGHRMGLKISQVSDSSPGPVKFSLPIFQIV